MKNKYELEKQENIITKNIILVFLIIFIIIISITLIRNNSISHLEKKYNQIRKESYSGKVTNLLLEKDDGRTRSIIIDNKWEKKIPFYIHKKLNVGDSLFKKKESDFEYYILYSTFDTIEVDLNKFYRKKYFDKKNKNKKP